MRGFKLGNNQSANQICEFTDERIFNFRSLPEFPNHEEALNLLKKLASHVKPIMQKHNWKVGTLEEFFPAEKNLLGLNINHGELFYRLTHNKCGPHDAAFYKLLDELNDEYDELLLTGHAGSGFYTDGVKLGTGVSHNITPAMAKQRALEAAERRKRIQSIMTNGGVRLGGDILESYSSMRELSAFAAERRRSDMIWCGSEESNGVNHAGPSRSSPHQNAKPRPVRIPENKLPGASTSSHQWSCPKCTFDNRPLALQCEVCSFERSGEWDSGHSPSQPIVIDNSANSRWRCPMCLYENDADVVMCIGCDYLMY
ncbi:16161_t:CDS:2 [Acaulospora morrowiae]|uniref:16161_t:CDS:1 n=1 Tax=Acaulospora morrowiae TaxID=94023 RepID=A0A9N9EYY3_9GLOM|nr:16161_t:CDS:2 [Acaulospora morrowiae]